MSKKDRIKNKFIKLEDEIKDLVFSFIFEPYTETKDMLECEITKMVKSKNLFSQYGGKYKTKIDIDPTDNFIQIDVRTNDWKWRLVKYGFYIDNITLKI
jgi:hypothetical protein